MTGQTPEERAREEQIEVMATAIRSFFGGEWVKWQGGAGVASLIHDALSAAGYKIVRERDER